jgi:hypothetical protein
VPLYSANKNSLIQYQSKNINTHIYWTEQLPKSLKPLLRCSTVEWRSQIHCN